DQAIVLHRLPLAQTTPRSAPDCVAAQTPTHTPVKTSGPADQQAEAPPYAILKVSYSSTRPLTGQVNHHREQPSGQPRRESLFWSRVPPTASCSVYPR